MFVFLFLMPCSTSCNTLEMAADCGKVPKGILFKQFKKRIGEYIDSIYERFPDDEDYDDDGGS